MAKINKILKVLILIWITIVYIDYYIRFFKNDLIKNAIQSIIEKLK